MQEQRFSIKGKTIIVTGASSGLGMGLSLEFAKAGANVMVASRNLSQLEAVIDEVESMGGKAAAVQTDVTRGSDVDRMINMTIERFGAIDVLLNNAGMSIPGLSAEEVSEDEMQMIMDTNFKGAFLCGTAVARYMLDRKKGKIINMSSVLGQTAWSKASIYCVSKAAISHMTKAWALEWASRNVTVNALAPTFIITEMNRDLLAQKDYKDRVLSHLPIGRIGELEDLVGPAIFLASNASDFVTGHILFVDGGWTCL